MRKPLVSLRAAALVALFLSAANVRADNLPWIYNAGSTTPTLHATTDAGPFPATITFQGNTQSLNGSSGIIIFNVNSNSLAPAGVYSTFNAVPFQLSVTLTDGLSSSLVDPTKYKKTFDFNGTFSASQVSGLSLLPGPITYDSTPQSYTFGDTSTGTRKYTIALTSFTSPGAPGIPGTIQAVVNIQTVTPGTGDGSGTGPSDSPEPASLVLAAFGLPMLVLVRRRLKKANAENNA